MGRASKYSEEFCRQAAMLVVDARQPVREGARELDVNHETLRHRVATNLYADPIGGRQAVFVSR